MSNETSSSLPEANATVSRVLYFFDQPLVVEIRTKQENRILAIKRDPEEEPLQ